MKIIHNVHLKFWGRFIRQMNSVLKTIYACYLQKVYRKVGMPWKINGELFRIIPNCRWRMSHDYDSDVARALKARVIQNACILNIGANVGVYTLQFARWCAPAGRVFAFEPNPVSREVLQQHIALNKLSDRVEIIPMAIGSVEGTVAFSFAGMEGMSRVGNPTPHLRSLEAQQIDVPMTTVDSFCLKHGIRPDFIFMDIEGLEIAALQGAAETIRARGRALQIAIELHPNAWDEFDTYGLDLSRLLEAHCRHPIKSDGSNAAIDEYGIVFLDSL
jgi:FkbM family methyltransferase